MVITPGLPSLICSVKTALSQILSERLPKSFQARNQTFLKGVLNLAWSHTNEKASQNRYIKIKLKIIASEKLTKIGGSSEPLEPPLVTGLLLVHMYIKS